MKKILIAILIILLLSLIYVTFTKGIDIGFIKIDSINNIKDASSKLNNQFGEANNLSNKEYPKRTEELEESIRKLKLSKQEYENKNSYAPEDEKLGATQIKKYEIDYLWTILGNYRKDRGVKTLNLDLKSTGTEDVYDLAFTLIGSYVSITDFLYDIESDEKLNFEIENFNLSAEITLQDDKVEANNNTQNAVGTNNQAQNTNNANETSTKKTDGSTLQATFTVKNIQIILDNKV